MRRLLQEVTELNEVPVLMIDNASAIKLVKNPEFHKRSKHIKVRYYFVREKYHEGVINVKHIASTNQIVDIMTKPLAKVQYLKLVKLLGLLS